MRAETEPFFTLRLDPETRAAVSESLLRACALARDDASERDDELLDFDDQSNARPLAGDMNRQKGLSTLVDPITQELLTTNTAQMAQATRSDKWVMVKSADPQREAAARVQEYWLSAKSAQYGLAGHFMDLAYNAGRDPAAILFTGWKQKIEEKPKRMFRRYDDGLDYELPPSESSADYEVVRRLETSVTDEGFDFRVVDLADFYLYPASSPTIDRAQLVFERQLLTEDELLAGIDAYGWDRREVFALIKNGPVTAEGDTYRQNRDDWDGTLNSAPLYYECFLAFGKMPLLRDSEGDLLVPEETIGRELMAMLCPNAGSVFYLNYSPLPFRPYLSFNLLRIPNRFLGHSICSLTWQLQAEMTANLRFALDSMNYQVSPVLKVSERWMQRYTQFRVYPGAQLPWAESKDEIEPLLFPPTNQYAFQAQQYLEGRAKSLVSAQGYGDLSPKVRKAAEIQNVMAAVQTKFALFVQTFQQSFPELARRMIVLWSWFKFGESDTFAAGPEVMQITGEDLEGQFIYLPTGSSQAATPEQRAAIAEKRLALVRSSPLYQMKLAAGDMGIEYRLLTDTLSAYDTPNPEALIGPPPPPPQPMGLGLPGMPGMGGPAMNGGLPMAAMNGAPGGAAQQGGIPHAG